MAIRPTLLSAAPTERVGRYPKHTFQTRELAFTAQPFFLAPVLPGETLSSLFMESRVITDPVLNPIIGWKKEYYFFYVRMSDLGVEEFKELFVDPANADLITSTSLETTSNVTRTYAAKGGIDWIDRCLTRVVDTYFRDEGETTAGHVTATTMAGTPIVQIRESSWMDSITDDADFATGAAISGATNADDLDRLMDAFEQLRAMGIANMTYEDFLRSYGIAIPNKDEGKPELIARFSDFQYPSNTINPSNGAPSSAVSWVFKNGERAKPRFFKEPGFLFGVSVTRPKVYFSGLAGTIASFMTRAWDWMPNYLADMPETSLKNFAADTGPLGDRTTATNSYWVDMRDLLMHGEQFQNMLDFNAVPATTGANHMLALPPGDVSNNAWKYPTEAMCKSFFVDNAGTNFYIRQDGYVSLSIKGRQIDYTSGNLAGL